MRGQQQVYNFLYKLGIRYEYLEHPATPTAESAREYWQPLNAMHCKNLFFRNHKGKKHYLVVFDFEEILKIKDLEERLKQAKYFEENGKKEGIVTTETGLQYEIITEGNGNKQTVDDNVTTHYHGTLLDGTVFDSSVERNEPASFPVGGVIRGWQEALQLMPVGSKWRLYVPSELAYGPQGAGQAIAPHTALIFEVELLSID
jgi:FKBP-type peptidyl-prolyl cis-trans isomerase FklB